MDTPTSTRFPLPGMRKMRDATCPRITQAALRAELSARLNAREPDPSKHRMVSLRRFFVIECGKGRVLDSTAEIIADILGCSVEELKTGELEMRGRGRPKDPDPLSRIRRAVRTYGKEDLLAALEVGVRTRSKGAGGVVVRLLRDFPADVSSEVRSATLRDQIKSLGDGTLAVMN